MMDCMLLREDHTRDITARVHWANDELSECHNEDALWGFAIRASGELEKTTKEKADDPVLYCLFCMGLFNWPGRRMLQEGMSLGVDFTTVVATRLFSRILGIEEGVHSPSPHHTGIGC